MSFFDRFRRRATSNELPPPQPAPVPPAPAAQRTCRTCHEPRPPSDFPEPPELVAALVALTAEATEYAYLTSARGKADTAKIEAHWRKLRDQLRPYQKYNNFDPYPRGDISYDEHPAEGSLREWFPTAPAPLLTAIADVHQKFYKRDRKTNGVAVQSRAESLTTYEIPRAEKALVPYRTTCLACRPHALRTCAACHAVRPLNEFLPPDRPSTMFVRLPDQHDRATDPEHPLFTLPCSRRVAFKDLCESCRKPVHIWPCKGCGDFLPFYKFAAGRADRPPSEQQVFYPSYAATCWDCEQQTLTDILKQA